jgi:hypothetical protein
MSSHVELLMQQRRALTSKLQQPFTGGFYSFDHSSHDSLHRVVLSAADTIRNAKQYEQAMLWAGQSEQSLAEAVEALEALSTAIACIQTHRDLLDRHSDAVQRAQHGAETQRSPPSLGS